MRRWLAFVARAMSAEQQIMAYAKLHELLDDLRTSPILDFDRACVVQFDWLRRSRIRIGTKDLRIAAIALAHDALLLSRNLTDFQKVHRLRVEDWARS